MNSINNIPEYKVSEFNHLIKEVIESNFNYVRIKGEISEIKIATRGQLYLTLKDKTINQLNAHFVRVASIQLRYVQIVNQKILYVLLMATQVLKL